MTCPRLTALLAAPACALLLGLSGCGGGDAPAGTTTPGAPGKPAAATAGTALPIKILTASGGIVTETLAAQGRLEVWRHEILAARAAGVISELPVLINQVVKQGDMLMQLKAPTEDLEGAARAAVKLERAKRDLARREALAKAAPETVSAADLDAVRDLVNDSELELRLYHQREENRRLIAPFAGVVINLTGVVGQQVAEGLMVGELLDTSRFRLALDLPEPSLRRLSDGQDVDLSALADASNARGRIRTLPGAIDPAKGTGRVLVDVTTPPASWRPGGFVTARLVLGETKADLVLPRDAVLYRENRPYVWIAETHEDKLVSRRAYLELGVGDPTRLIVTRGVNPGEQVVIEGMNGLSDGVPVAIRTDDPPAEKALDAAANDAKPAAEAGKKDEKKDPKPEAKSGG